MSTDSLTDGIARIAIISGAAAYTRYAAGPIAVKAGEAIMQLPGTDGMTTAAYLGTTEFKDAVHDLSEALADASLNGPEQYLAFLAAIDENRITGRVLLRPANKSVPDAAASLVPWLLETGPVIASKRIYPAQPLLDMISAAQDPDNPMDANAITAWCMANPGNLLISDGPAESIKYTGWNASLGRAVSILAVNVDFEKPWRISIMPDGSEEIIPALPLKPAEPELSYWEADSSWAG